MNRAILDTFRKDYPLIAVCILSASKGPIPLNGGHLNMGPEYWRDKARNFIVNYGCAKQKR